MQPEATDSVGLINELGLGAVLSQTWLPLEERSMEAYNVFVILVLFTNIHIELWKEAADLLMTIHQLVFPIIIEKFLPNITIWQNVYGATNCSSIDPVLFTDIIIFLLGLLIGDEISGVSLQITSERLVSLLCPTKRKRKPT